MLGEAVMLITKQKTKLGIPGSKLENLPVRLSSKRSNLAQLFIALKHTQLYLSSGEKYDCSQSIAKHHNRNNNI